MGIYSYFKNKSLAREAARAIVKPLGKDRRYRIIPKGATSWSVEYQNIIDRKKYAWSHYGVYDTQRQAEEAIKHNIELHARDVAEEVIAAERLFKTPPRTYPKDGIRLWMWEVAFNQAMHNKRKEMNND